MTNNDILRCIRYTFDFDDTKIISIFALGGCEVTLEQIGDWLKSNDDPEYKACRDVHFASFLNGFIAFRRGKKEGAQPEPETRLTNNIIFRKLTIALDLKSEDILEILAMVDMNLSKRELSAFFRKDGNKHYRVCKDQILGDFLKGIQLMYRDSDE